MKLTSPSPSAPPLPLPCPFQSQSPSTLYQASPFPLPPNHHLDSLLLSRRPHHHLESLLLSRRPNTFPSPLTVISNCLYLPPKILITTNNSSIFILIPLSVTIFTHSTVKTSSSTFSSLLPIRSPSSPLLLRRDHA